MTKKKIQWACLTLLLLSGCSTGYRYRADYDYAIRQAKVNHQTMPVSAKSLGYQDDWMEVSFLPGAEGVNMNLLNIANENLHVIWDQCVLIHKHRALKVMHNGVKFSQAHDFMPNSVIPPATLITDYIAPADFVSYQPATEYSAGYWKQDQILPHLYTRAPEHEYAVFKAAVQAAEHTELYGLLLTLEKGNEIRTYQFDFEVSSARILDMQAE